MYITDSGGILLTIQEAAKEIGVVPATIRNWEKQGVFTSKRADNGYRVFDHEDMTKLRGLLRFSKEKKISVSAAQKVFFGGYPAEPEPPKAPQVLQSEKWKKCRLERGFGLEEVAKAVKISSSYLHKIENSQTNVSLDILQRLADFYGENLLYYIADAQDEKHLVRKASGSAIDIGLEGVSVESLIAMSKFNLSAMLYTIAPNSGRNHTQSHHGEEFIYVLSGKIHFTLSRAEYVLSAGDSFSFRSPDTHSWFNHEKKEAQLLWIYTPVM
ncbi:MAG: cupin domain-containing protein [Spirochaetaceae bacterium]|jgi:DNA-binding transcriptional MerR regulator|nr:cupin domain-containing protein [Spirochaetaceae bacterium]